MTPSDMDMALAPVWLAQVLASHDGEPDPTDTPSTPETEHPFTLGFV